MQLAARVAIKLARENDLYVVIDADGLFLVQNDPSVVKGYKRAVLTPNVVEFQRLAEKLVSLASLLLSPRRFVPFSLPFPSLLTRPPLPAEHRQIRLPRHRRLPRRPSARRPHNRPKRPRGPDHERQGDAD